MLEHDRPPETGTGGVVGVFAGSEVLVRGGETQAAMLSRGSTVSSQCCHETVIWRGVCLLSWMHRPELLTDCFGWGRCEYTYKCTEEM